MNESNCPRLIGRGNCSGQTRPPACHGPSARIMGSEGGNISQAPCAASTAVAAADHPLSVFMKWRHARSRRPGMAASPNIPQALPDWTARSPLPQSMVRKSGYRFCEKDHAQTKSESLVLMQSTGHNSAKQGAHPQLRHPRESGDPVLRSAFGG